MTEMSCREVLPHLAKLLHKGHDDLKDKPFELEMTWVCEASGWTHRRVPQNLIDEADAWAKAKIEEEEMADSDDDESEDESEDEEEEV